MRFTGGCGGWTGGQTDSQTDSYVTNQPVRKQLNNAPAITVAYFNESANWYLPLG